MDYFRCLCYNCTKDCCNKTCRACSDYTTSCAKFVSAHNSKVMLYAYHKYQQAIEVLKEVEWTNELYCDWKSCPYCGQLKSSGHSPDCLLSQLLKEDN